MTHPAPLTEGQSAPDFTLPRDGGTDLTLSQFRPGRVVLVTYGGDGTPSCTNELQEFNALLPAFAKAGCTVIGMSKDSVKKHDGFIAKQGLGMILVSDTGTVMENWGAFGEKLFFGKLVQGVLRSTFLIDGTGKLQKIWKVDRVKGHAAEVLAAAQATQ